MLGPLDVKWGSHFGQAQAWLRDHELRNWVTEPCEAKGIAPVTGNVWLQKHTGATQCSTGAPRPEKSARWKLRQRNQWVQRWAKRHQVTQGAFKDGERLPINILQSKAPRSEQVCPQSQTWSAIAVRNSWPESGLANWAHTPFLHLRDDQFPAPSSRSLFEPVSKFGHPIFQTPVRPWRHGGGTISWKPMVTEGRQWCL